LSTPAAAQNKPLPWDGRAKDLTVATLENKFMLHIFKQKPNGGVGNPADWVTVQQKGRSPAYNNDTGVINIAVDNKSIFGGQMNFRRSELVQNVASAGTTYFRASIMANEVLKNKYFWQVFFPESHSWEVFVDANSSPMKIQFRTEARVQWETAFTTKTWFNFGIAVTGSGTTLYTSTGNAALAKAWSDTKSPGGNNGYELHFGLLTLSNDGSVPRMSTGQDILSFSGVSVETQVSTAGGAGGASADAPAAPAANSPAAPASRAPANPAPRAPSNPAPRTPTSNSTPRSPATAPSASPVVAPAAPGNKCKSRRRN
jgi:hypothetical protein